MQGEALVHHRNDVSLLLPINVMMTGSLTVKSELHSPPFDKEISRIGIAAQTHVWFSQLSVCILRFDRFPYWTRRHKRLGGRWYHSLTLNSLLSFILSCARVMSPAFGRPRRAILSCSVKSSGAFASASVIAFASSSSAPHAEPTQFQCAFSNFQAIRTEQRREWRQKTRRNYFNYCEEHQFVLLCVVVWLCSLDIFVNN